MTKILVVDDSETVVVMLKMLLEQNGYEVIVAVDGMEGLNKAKSESPDAIILDVMLPKMDGYKVCRMLKFDERYNHIPIAMFTTRVLDLDHQTGKEVGADAYLNKDVDPDQILSALKKLLEKNKS